MTTSAYISNLTPQLYPSMKSSSIQSLSYDSFHHLVYALLGNGWICVFSLDRDGLISNSLSLFRVEFQAS